MDENTSLRNCTYGFQAAGGRTVYSNLPQSHLGDWLARLEEAHSSHPFLEEGHDLVVVDLNQSYLDSLLAQLFPQFLPETAYQRVPIPLQAHHTAPSFLEVYQAKNGSLLRKVYGRVKGRDSLTEKLTREFAAQGTMCFDSSKLPLHPLAKDIYAFTAVADSEETLHSLDEQLKFDPRLCLIQEKDYLIQPKESGYRALHRTFTWQRNTLPYGLVLEVHLETEEDYYQNRLGSPACPRRGHADYSRAKLLKPHSQGNNQIIILEKNGSDHEELEPVAIKKRFVEYTLVNY